MLYSKSQIKQSITKISLNKQQYDQQFSQIQTLMMSQRTSRIPITKLRYQFQDKISKLREMVKTNNEQLDVLRYRADKLKEEGHDMSANIRSIQSLKEYFNELNKKVKSENEKGQERLSQRERQELNNHHDDVHYDEESQLMVSANSAKQTKEIAQEVLSNLQNQTGKLSLARQKMTDIIQNINFSGNLVNLIKSRSKEDNKLIMLLTLGLILQIIICIYVIRPLLKG